MILTHKRPAFSLITAIFVMVIMGVLSVFVLNLAGKAVQETTAQYRKEQAILYAKSYTEFAIMAASSQDCVDTITADLDGKGTATSEKVLEGQGYHVYVNIQYIGSNAGCTQEIGNDVVRPESIGGSILVDTYVRYRNPEHPNSLSTVTWATNPGYTYHRRTLQRL